jgi:hypothetical protein
MEYYAAIERNATAWRSLGNTCQVKKASPFPSGVQNRELCGDRK